MKNTHVLPFETEPLVRSYHSLAFPMGIIQANAQKDLTEWYCGKYINCHFMLEYPQNRFNTCTYDEWGAQEGILLYQHFYMQSDLYKQLVSNIVDIVKRFLLCDCYVSGMYNERYIPGKSAYGKYDYLHDYIIYGYDDDTQSFLSAGYLLDGKYQSFSITYENFENSINNLNAQDIMMETWKYNDRASFALNLPRIREDLADYLASRNSKHVYTDDKAYGRDGILRLKEYFETTFEAGIDLRYTRALMEHRHFMLLRFQYFANQGVVPKEDAERMKETYDKAEKIHLLGIKYNMTHKNSYIGSISKLIDEILEFEWMPLNCLLEKLNS